MADLKNIGVIVLAGAAAYLLLNNNQQAQQQQQGGGGGSGAGFDLAGLLGAQGANAAAFMGPDANAAGETGAFSSSNGSASGNMPAYGLNLEGLLAGFNQAQGQQLFTKKQLAGGAVMYAPDASLPADIQTRLQNVGASAATLAQGEGSQFFYSAKNPKTGDAGIVYAPKGLNAAFGGSSGGGAPPIGSSAPAPSLFLANNGLAGIAATYGQSSQGMSKKNNTPSLPNFGGIFGPILGGFYGSGGGGGGAR